MRCVTVVVCLARFGAAALGCVEWPQFQQKAYPDSTGVPQSGQVTVTDSSMTLGLGFSNAAFASSNKDALKSADLSRTGDSVAIGLSRVGTSGLASAFTISRTPIDSNFQ